MYGESVFLVFLDNQRALEAGKIGVDLVDLSPRPGLQMAKSNLSTATPHVWNTTHTNATHTDRHYATVLRPVLTTG